MDAEISRLETGATVRRGRAVGREADVQRTVRFTVPLTPVSVNQYKMRSRYGHWYVTDDAKAFKQAVAIFGRDSRLQAKAYGLRVTVYLGKGKKGDGDNFWKVIGDGLKEAGVIHSDAAVKDWSMTVKRDWTNPRTEIEVRTLGCIGGK